MYSQGFYIREPVGNNAFSFEKRKNKQLYVPSLKKITSFDEIRLTDEITFEDYDFDDILQTCHGLENLYEIPPLTLPLAGEKKLQAPIYLVDNHNHVFYFWYLARSQGIISDDALLYHIDEHADTRDPGKYLLKPNSEDLQKVFEYTNFTLNVGNYIIPAEKEGLVGETIQIRSEHALEEYCCLYNIVISPIELRTGSAKAGINGIDKVPLRSEGFLPSQEGQKRNIILNLDLDFFSPGLDYIDYELKKNVILDIAKKADLITVCTSPFFIEQESALRVLQDNDLESEL